MRPVSSQHGGGRFFFRLRSVAIRIISSLKSKPGIAEQWLLQYVGRWAAMNILRFHLFGELHTQLMRPSC